MPTDMNRQEIYRGLLSAIGNYEFVSAYISVGRGEFEFVDIFDENKYKQIIDWIFDGYEPTILVHHVWGVGGGRGSDFSYTYCKDRYVEWDSEECKWNVDTSKKYVIDNPENARGTVRTSPVFED